MAGCASSREAPDDAPGTTAESLVEYLRREGVTLFYDGPVTHPQFITTGQQYDLPGGETLQVFEYRTESTATLDLNKIDRMRLSPGIPPQVYHDGRLIVIYMGDNVTVEQNLSDVLGSSETF